jgi:hypothetical protein
VWWDQGFTRGQHDIQEEWRRQLQQLGGGEVAGYLNGGPGMSLLTTCYPIRKAWVVRLVGTTALHPPNSGRVPFLGQ